MNKNDFQDTIRMSRTDIDGEFFKQKTVRSHAAVCRRLFLDILSFNIEDDANVHGLESHIQDEFGRFNLWTANNDVFTPVLASLDNRLVDSPAFKEQLLGQLEALRSKLNESRAWFRRSTSCKFPTVFNSISQDTKKEKSS